MDIPFKITDILTKLKNNDEDNTNTRSVIMLGHGSVTDAQNYMSFRPELYENDKIQLYVSEDHAALKALSPPLKNTKSDSVSENNDKSNNFLGNMLNDFMNPANV